MDDLSTAAEPFSYRITAEPGGALVVALMGELDMSSTAELGAAVGERLGPTVRRLVIDAAGLRFGDSAALALWVDWSRRVPTMEIHGAGPIIRRVIESMGLGEVLGLR